MKYLSALLVVPLAPAAISQTLLKDWAGPENNDLFGWAVDGAGDVNADGYDDVIVGAESANKVYVYSGFDYTP
ncbi:MAG: integrin alpha [Planctomycetota bacterium]|nr:integrin alpha [Planctomycetota bacterium]